MAINNRILELNQLKDNVAGLNKKAAQQEKAALGMSLQSAVQKAPTAPGSAVQTAQQLAPKVTQAAGQAELTAQKKTQQVQGQLTQRQIQDTAFQFAQNLKKESNRLNAEIFQREQASGMLVSNAELAARKRIVKADMQVAKRVQALVLRPHHPVRQLAGQGISAEGISHCQGPVHGSEAGLPERTGPTQTLQRAPTT